MFPSLRLDAALGGGRPALPVPVPFTQSRVSSGGGSPPAPVVVVVVVALC